MPERPGHRAALDRLELWNLTAASAIAALLHVGLLILCLLDWNGFFAKVFAPEPQAIPVALIFEPPPAPPKPAPPPPPVAEPVKPPEPPPAPEMRPRMSGSDETTSAIATETPKPALPQTAPEPKPAPKRPHSGEGEEKHPAAIKAEPKPAEREARLPAAPQAHSGSRGEVLPGIQLATPYGGSDRVNRAGDPYLNQLRDLIERNRNYPRPTTPDNQKVAVYRIVVDPDGDLTAITLVESSGSSLLDEAASRMIRITAPFPPLPLKYPNMRMLITVGIPFAPPAR